MTTATRCPDCHTYTCVCEWTCWTCQRRPCPPPGTYLAAGQVECAPVEPRPSQLVAGGALEGLDLDALLGDACPGCGYRIKHHPTCEEEIAS